MQNLFKKVEFFSNIAIIIVALGIGGFFVSRYFTLPNSDQPISGSNELKTGTKLPLIGTDWNKNSKTLLIALSTNCRFCTASQPFYKNLFQQKSAQGNFGVVVIAPQSIDEARQYLSKSGIEADDVRQSALSEINVKATPTLVLLDNTGAIVNSWVGKLSPEKENEVIQTLSR